MLFEDECGSSRVKTARLSCGALDSESDQKQHV